MKLDVISYCANMNYHDCRDKDGEVHHVNLIVEGSLPDEIAENPKLLVGKSVEVGSVFPFLLLADGVRIIEETEEGKK